ncbi:hypothetical protein VHARVF571_460307 [Vibrio harveyi]|nr:hypothetical protein VHARVF571_460307 [Vibrio harveyi]
MLLGLTAQKKDYTAIIAYATLALEIKSLKFSLIKWIFIKFMF